MSTEWTFLTNHAHVLLSLAATPNATLREVAQQVGITERATHRIVAELESEGALKRFREGRRNRYEIQQDFPLRHPLEQHRSVGHLVDMVGLADRN